MDVKSDAETVTFETASFSEYALVLTGNTTQKETEFSGDQYFEMDKYLSDPIGVMNGQNTYNVYLEQAYYDGSTPHRVINNAPDAQDIILVLDQSASMGGSRVETLNKSVESLLKQMQTINNVRLENAKNGVYTDIDPDGDVEAAMKGMLDPVFEEKVIGHAIVRQTFKASGVGTIAGAYVTDGKFQRGCSCRLSRGGEQLFDGGLTSLKRFKDDVKEVAAGYECGLVFDKFNDIQEDDTIEAYIMVEVSR